MRLFKILLSLAAVTCYLAPTVVAAPPAHLDGPALNRSLQARYENGERTFRIPASVYTFPVGADRDFVLNNWAGASIDADGVTFLCNAGGVKLNHCSAVTIKGLIIDNDPAPLMQGVVKAIDPVKRTLDLTLDPAYQMPPAGGIPRDKGRLIQFYPPDGKDPVRQEGEVSWRYESLGGNDYRIELRNNRMFRVGDKPDIIAPGYRVVVTVATGSSGFTLTDCRQTTLARVHVYASSGFAISELGGEGGNVYRDCVVGRKPGTDRLLAGNRDAFHSYRMRKGPTIENCDFSYTGDDMIAIHGFFDVVESQPEPTKLVMAAPFGHDFEVGTTLRFYDFQTTQPQGEAVIRSMIKLEGADVAARIQQVPIAMHDKHFAARGFPADSAELFEVTFDRPVQTTPLSIASSGDYCGNGAIIRGNHLHDNNSRGVIVKANDVLIEGNTMDRLACSAVAIFPESFWLEGSFANRMRITKNTITDCGEISYNDRYMEPALGAIQVSDLFGKHLFNPPTFNGYALNSQITIESNRIVRPAVFAIFLANVNGAVIANNIIEQPHRRRAWIDHFDLSGTIKDASGPSTFTGDQMSVLQHPLFASLLFGSTNIAISGNKVSCDLPGYRGDWGLGPWTSNIETSTTANPK
ncbi:MAG: right-handed parallel beta-helix repeat-containing protein [Capsulimonadaceae bacterium]|nr:right-handed parallel beta-helix repeat-containing protein [Capsulimonadaceae bacterium]